MTGRNGRDFSPLMEAVVDLYLGSAGARRLSTQKARAKDIGASLATMRRIENGTHVIDIDELEAMARAMGMTPEALLEDARRVRDRQS